MRSFQPNFFDETLWDMMEIASNSQLPSVCNFQSDTGSNPVQIGQGKDGGQGGIMAAMVLSAHSAQFLHTYWDNISSILPPVNEVKGR